eukprot:2921936-Amphidinium_carterae.1
MPKSTTASHKARAAQPPAGIRAQPQKTHALKAKFESSTSLGFHGAGCQQNGGHGWLLTKT